MTSTEASLEEIRRVASEARPALKSYNNCGYINREIADALQDTLGIDCDYYEGSAADPDSRRQPIDEHAFVRIPANNVADAAYEVRVDGAISQFCDAREGDQFFFSLGSKETLPTVAVLTPHDRLYNALRLEDPQW